MPSSVYMISLMSGPIPIKQLRKSLIANDGMNGLSFSSGFILMDDDDLDLLDMLIVTGGIAAIGVIVHVGGVVGMGVLRIR